MCSIFLIISFFTCSFAGNYLYPVSRSCSDGYIDSLENAGYESDVLVLNSTFPNFTFDDLSCLNGYAYIMFKESVNVSFSELNLFSSLVAGLLFDENSETTFLEHYFDLNFFDELQLYEFRENSMFTYNGDLEIEDKELVISNSSVFNLNGYIECMSSCDIQNGSVLNVHGYIQNTGSFTVTNSVVNIYQFNSNNIYSISKQCIGMKNMKHLSIVNGDLNIYGINYNDTDGRYDNETHGLYSSTLCSTELNLINSTITLYPVEGSNYFFEIHFDCDKPNEVNNFYLINSTIVSENVTFFNLELSNCSLIESNQISFKQSVTLTYQSMIKTNNLQVEGSLLLEKNSLIETTEYIQINGNLEVNDNSTIYLKNTDSTCSIENVQITSSNTINDSPLFQSESSHLIFNSNTISSSTCFDIFSSFEINTNEYDGFLINKCDGRLKRYCPDIVEEEVFCEFYENIWVNEFSIDSNPFNYYHCMNNCGNDNCYIKSLTTEPIIIVKESINVTFIENNVVLYFNNTSINYIEINSFELELLSPIKSVTHSKSLKKSNDYSIANSYLLPPSNDTVFLGENMQCGFVCITENGFNCLTSYDCSYGYYMNNNQCNECPTNCRTCNSTDNCYLCEYGYVLENGYCIEDFNCIRADRNYCNICNDGLLLNGNTCSLSCEDTCISCNTETCYYCDETFNINGKCQNIINAEIVSNNSIVQCSNYYYNNVDKSCELCDLIYSNCNICNNGICIECSNGYYLNNNVCESMNCLNSETSIKGYCNNCDTLNGYIVDENGKCVSKIYNCLTHINGKCIECNDGYILQSENNCIFNEYPNNCITLSYYGTCQRCSDGYYLNNNLCYECSNECTKCHNLTYCFECNDGYMLNDNNECVDMSELNSNCKTAIPGNSGGCAICFEGYYRNQTSCLSCISNCTKCNNGESCLSCESDYFLLNDASECISYDDLTNCETKTQSGCTKCVNDSYYLNNQYCTSCSDTTENCNTCNNNGECLTCQNEHILINYECINYQLIDNCKESYDSKCTSCSFWHTPNSDQTGCDKQIVWWVIVLIVLFILIVLIGICVLIWYLIKLLLDWGKQQKQRKQTTIFDMKTSNIQFVTTNNKDVVINKDEILFNDECDEIGVNEETRDLICVGNTSKHTIKVQFSVKDGCDKYEIRTNPQLITIPKGKAIEFEIFIKPLCTCKINDQIMLISVDLSKGKTITTPITINTITIMTTRLDYSELIEDVKLGEGSFGIVYKGTFRGNQVAIKKMKQLNDKTQIEEFHKEVSMLDKFRNDYIVHFYGAVFIPNKICMVTELAQYGSLQDLMNKTKGNPIDYTIKMKILLDCSKGISYLHSNGILHRDIKPDNFLILSLDTNVQVNAKLTDFGSSRNINMLMTNMTFTKGIGTPVYMAPEVLKHNKYKKAADIYSFAITMYETIIWDGAYPKDRFKFPWKIAEFITNGERLPKPDTINESIYLLIDNCWKHEPKERYEIEEVVEKLESMK